MPGDRRGRARLGWPELATAAYFAVLAWLSRGVAVDCWDGFGTLTNSVLVGGGGPSYFYELSVFRPPGGWLLSSPLVAWAYRSSGPEAALRLCHLVMTAYAALLVYVCYRALRAAVSPAAAALALLPMALNPALIRFSPFALQDVFSAITIVPFLVAAYRYVEAPSARGYWLLYAAYTLAFLSKYPLGILILIPIAYRFIAPGRRSLAARLKAGLLTPLWLMPILCAAASAILLIVLTAVSSPLPMRQAPAWVWSAFANNFYVNLVAPQDAGRVFYLRTLLYQLGPAFCALMCLGAGVWLARRRAQDLFLAVAFAVPLAFLVLDVNPAFRELRYVFMLFPTVYAAVGEGLAACLAALPKTRAARAALTSACLAAAPWAQAAASARYLLSDPALHNRMPWDLARAVEDATQPGDCVAWTPGDVSLYGDRLDDPGNFSLPTMVLAQNAFQYLVHRPVQSLGEAMTCSPALIVVPRQGPEGARWTEPALARVYRAIGRSPAGKPLFEALPDRVAFPAR